MMKNRENYSDERILEIAMIAVDEDWSVRKLEAELVKAFGYNFHKHYICKELIHSMLSTV